jgi:hypothetical protein
LRPEIARNQKFKVQIKAYTCNILNVVKELDSDDYAVQLLPWPDEEDLRTLQMKRLLRLRYPGP